MASRPDLVLYDRYGGKAAVVEVKNKRGTSQGWAAEMRRNLLEHEAFQHAPFFLLATPDRLYLWREELRSPGLEPEPAPPDLTLDAQPLFGPYLERAGRNLERVSEQGLELVVMSWLADLALQIPEVLRQAKLEASGLPEAARDGRVALPVAA